MPPSKTRRIRARPSAPVAVGIATVWWTLFHFRQPSLPRRRWLARSQKDSCIRAKSACASDCTTHQVNTPLNHHEPEAPAEEVEVTDPAHPLFGRRFEILSVHDAPGLVGHVHVSHRGHMHIRIELRATDLAPSPPPLPATKLTSQAVIELAQLAGQCEVLYAAQPAQRCLGKPIAGGPNSSHKGDVNDPHGGDR